MSSSSAQILKDQREAARLAKEKKEEEDASQSKCSCLKGKVAILRFVGLCLIALLILCGTYGLRSTTGDGKERGIDGLYAVGDPVFARDLWLIVEVPSDARGRRTRLGKKIRNHVCSAIRAGQAVGWTPLVVGGRSNCCSSSRCRHLHPSDLDKMNHSLSLHFWHRKDDIGSALRTAGFLAAIKRGAHFVFQANPEVFFYADISADDYRSELTYQLRKMTLGISVGLVKENPSAQYHFDPYSHFSPDHQVKKRSQNPQGEDVDEDIIYKYKVCEIRPPSLEKFLDADGFSLDESAPALTLPGQISAPFDSRNTMFGREALWSLLVLPTSDSAKNSDELGREDYVIRTILAQTVLREIGGSTKYNVANTPTSIHVKELTEFGPRVKDLLEFVQKWTCGTGSALICINGLVKDLVQQEILDEDSSICMDLWINDLLDVGYADIPTVSKNVVQDRGPCIGDDALPGVYFHPAVPQHALGSSRGPKALSFDEDVGRRKPVSVTQLNRQIAAKSIQKLCPTVNAQSALVPGCNNCDNHENLLLIVTFNKPEYNNIPLFEVIYRHHFQNILYCGEPNKLVDEYMEQYQGIQGTYFSFLPAHSKTGYECLLGAIEMGYNVEGYLVVTHDALINSWNFENLDPKTIWHGNQNAVNITAENIETIDPDHSRVMQSTLGILKAFEFLEEVLLRGPPAKKMQEHMHLDYQRRMKKRRYRRSDDATPEQLSIPADGPFEELNPGEETLHEEENKESLANEESEENLYKEEEVVEEEVLHREDYEENLDKEDDEDYLHEEEDEESKLTKDIQEYDSALEENTDEDMSEDGISGMGENHEETSVVDSGNATVEMLFKKNFHISLFGEIIQDDERDADPVLELSLHPLLTNHAELGHEDLINITNTVAAINFRNVTELLFHPANFHLGSEHAEDLARISTLDGSHDMDHYDEMMFNIHRIYKSIREKLNFWHGLVKNGRRHKVDFEDTLLKKDLEHFQCDISTNSEICHLVSDFFNTLEDNEGSNFRLFYDDLPIYYVPSKQKDKLYLMANLFTKYQISDQLAFPLLLRGLASTSEWANLEIADMPDSKESSRPVVKQPQDLLLLGDFVEERSSTLEVLESAHYIYPVDMVNVLKNEAMRDVICRNF